MPHPQLAQRVQRIQRKGSSCNQKVTRQGIWRLVGSTKEVQVTNMKFFVVALVVPGMLMLLNSRKWDIITFGKRLFSLAGRALCAQRMTMLLMWGTLHGRKLVPLCYFLIEVNIHSTHKTMLRASNHQRLSFI